VSLCGFFLRAPLQIILLSLNDIVITETNTSNFSSGTNVTLIFRTHFEFKPNTGSVSLVELTTSISQLLLPA
jgi:hypothetical protein